MYAVECTYLLWPWVAQLAWYPHLTKVDAKSITPNRQPANGPQGLASRKCEDYILISVRGEDIQGALVIRDVDAIA